ncbi:MAG: hypothetical protein M0P73_12455 [Syntrophobacterales bacterium]|jgi:hypothetical protein|nr:hypothetical protein [Syntrophobacterales bacterium]
MEKRTASLLFIIMVGVIGISLVGCAGAPTVTAPAKTMPEMLKEAGFKVFVADTPQKMAHLQTCPSDTLMIHERPGTKCYAFSDPATKTMYVGDDAAYSRLQGLLEKQRQTIREQRIQSDPQFWPLWVDSQGGG